MEDKKLTPWITKLAPGDLVGIDADGNIKKIDPPPKLSLIDKTLVALHLKKKVMPRVDGVYSSTGVVMSHSDKAIRVKLSGDTDSAAIGKILEANKNRATVDLDIK